MLKLSDARADWALPLPEGMGAKDAAKIGTAGYTAMLCIQVNLHQDHLNLC